MEEQRQAELAARRARLQHVKRAAADREEVRGNIEAYISSVTNRIPSLLGPVRGQQWGDAACLSSVLAVEVGSGCINRIHHCTAEGRTSAPLS